MVSPRLLPRFPSMRKTFCEMAWSSSQPLSATRPAPESKRWRTIVVT